MQVNVLVTDEHRACLADFGLSTTSDSQVLNLSSFSTKHTGGTLRWTAPEIFEGEQSINTSSSDIYSFACVSYEVFAYWLVRYYWFHILLDFFWAYPIRQNARSYRNVASDSWTAALSAFDL